MKKIEKLKLNRLSSEELKKRELNQMRGGDGPCCTCCCGYRFEPGGSSISENWAANHATGEQNSYDPGYGCACGDHLPVGEGRC